MRQLHFKTYKPRKKLRNALISGLLVILLGFLSPFLAEAQFVNLSMEVETELSVVTIKDLDFGTAPVESGKLQIRPGDPGIGIFKVRGLRNLQLFISFDAPKKLRHAEPNVDASIPIDLKFAYNNRGHNNSRQATRIDGRNTSLTLSGREGEVNETLSEYFKTEWANMYLYVFGTLNIGNIPAGIYKENITVTIEY